MGLSVMDDKRQHITKVVDALTSSLTELGYQKA